MFTSSGLLQRKERWSDATRRLMPTVNQKVERRASSYDGAFPLCTALLRWTLQKRVTGTLSTTYETSIWRYEVVRPALADVFKLDSTEYAVRRVTEFANLHSTGQVHITLRLRACLQILLSKRGAPHAAYALRLGIDGRCAYKVVGDMSGGFVIKPRMAWRDRSNLRSAPLFPLAGLNIHVGSLQSVSFRYGSEVNVHSVDRHEDVALTVVGRNFSSADRSYRPQIPQKKKPEQSSRAIPPAARACDACRQAQGRRTNTRVGCRRRTDRTCLLGRNPDRPPSMLLHF